MFCLLVKSFQQFSSLLFFVLNNYNGGNVERQRKPALQEERELHHFGYLIVVPPWPAAFSPKETFDFFKIARKNKNRGIASTAIPHSLCWH
jgi:hypothetical protein